MKPAGAQSVPDWALGSQGQPCAGLFELARCCLTNAMPLPRDAKAAMEQVASVIRPVSITMLFVVYCMVALCNPYSFSRASCRDSTGSALRFYMVYKENDADSTGEKLTGAITNAAAMVGMMVVITFMMFFCYKYRCTKLIWAYLVFSVGGLLAIFGSMWLTQVIEKYGIVMDWITLVVGIFNWSAIGVSRASTPPPAPPSMLTPPGGLQGSCPCSGCRRPSSASSTLSLSAP